MMNAVRSDIDTRFGGQSGCDDIYLAIAHTQNEGGMGVISTAQVAYDAPLFRENPETANLQVLPFEIRKAKQISENKGMVAVNIMSVTQLYGQYVRKAVEAGVDAIISGAGLPIDLPEYVKGSEVKIAPIVSSKKAAEIILKYWDKKYHRTADFLVMEGPTAGGHLGFSKEELEALALSEQNFAENVKETIRLKTQYEEKYRVKIPVFVAGGISDRADVLRVLALGVLALGADGVQVASKFVATQECDASDEYKQAYIAKTEDLVIIESPVGMPARALRNPFVERMLDGSGNMVKSCFERDVKYGIVTVFKKYLCPLQPSDIDIIIKAHFCLFFQQAAKVLLIVMKNFSNVRNFEIKFTIGIDIVFYILNQWIGSSVWIFLQKKTNITFKQCTNGFAFFQSEVFFHCINQKGFVTEVFKKLPAAVLLIQNVPDKYNAGNFIIDDDRAGVFVQAVYAETVKGSFCSDGFVDCQISAAETFFIAAGTGFKFVTYGSGMDFLLMGKLQLFVAVIAQKEDSNV